MKVLFVRVREMMMNLGLWVVEYYINRVVIEFFKVGSLFVLLVYNFWDEEKVYLLVIF